MYIDINKSLNISNIEYKYNNITYIHFYTYFYTKNNKKPTFFQNFNLKVWLISWFICILSA